MLTGTSLRRGVNTETLTGASTITIAELHKYAIQVLDPGGAGRTVTLPAEVAADGLSVMVKNSADAAEVLTIVDDAGATVCTIDQNGQALIFSVGGAWYALVTGLSTVSDAELAFVDGVTAGTALASKAMVLDASKNITGVGGITSTNPTGPGLGYGTGAGGAVTQATDRTTGVTLSKLTGTITTHNASLAAEAADEFTVTNTTVAVGDVVVVSQRSGSNGGNTNVFVSTVAAGSFKIKVANNNAAAGTAETGPILINFAVIKAVSA